MSPSLRQHDCPTQGTRIAAVGCANVLTIALAVLQSTSAPADIQLQATVRARSLTIEKKGEVSLTITADGRNVLDVQAPKSNGRKTISKPDVRVNVEARIAEPLAVQPGSTPQK